MARPLKVKPRPDHLAAITTNIAAYGRNTVPDSPFFEAIMDKYVAVGKQMSVRKFWDTVVKIADPNISFKKWDDFMKKFRASCDMRKAAILRRTEDRSIADSKLEEDGLRKILALADVSLDDLISEPATLEKISKPQLIDWFFKAMKSRDSRMTVMLKKREDDRKQTVYEEIMEDAQYGASTSLDYGDDDEEEEEYEKEIPALPPAHVFEPPMPEAVREEYEAKRTGVRTVEFNPDEL